MFGSTNQRREHCAPPKELQSRLVPVSITFGFYEASGNLDVARNHPWLRERDMNRP